MFPEPVIIWKPVQEDDCVSTAFRIHDIKGDSVCFDSLA